MLGGIVIAVILVVVIPVTIMMSMVAVAALLGTTTKNAVDGDHADSELLEISEANPY